MKAKVIEISGYAGAFAGLYITNKNVTEDRLSDILNTIEKSTDRFGFVKYDDIISAEKFNQYLDKIMRYGIKHEHETLMDFIKITIFMEGLHRGAQDDFDAHARRLDILRSSTRANMKSSSADAELSNWYKDKIMTFDKAFDNQNIGLNKSFQDSEGIDWVKTPWGYVKKGYENNPDVLRGLVPLGLACDNVSTVSFRNLRHIYNLRRKGSHAAPELQNAMEQIRKDLESKCPILEDFLGKIWVPEVNDYIERPDTVTGLRKPEKD